MSGAAVGGQFGGWYGAAIGAVVGFVAGGLLAESYAAELGDASEFSSDSSKVTTADEGTPIPDVLGTVKLSGNIIWVGEERREAVESGGSKKGGGKGGGKGGENISGYEYYRSWAVALCEGPIDRVFTIYKGDECVWHGVQERPESGGVV